MDGKTKTISFLVSRVIHWMQHVILKQLSWSSLLLYLCGLPSANTLVFIAMIESFREKFLAVQHEDIWKGSLSTKRNSYQNTYWLEWMIFHSHLAHQTRFHHRTILLLTLEAVNSFIWDLRINTTNWVTSNDAAFPPSFRKKHWHKKHAYKAMNVLLNRILAE